MTRAEFLAAVQGLAERLGAELWIIVERQTDRARAAALEVAVGKLRGEIAGDGDPGPGPAEPVERRRAPRRCSSCRQLGHDARRCDGAAAAGAEPQADAEEDKSDEPPPLHEPTDSPRSKPQPARGVERPEVPPVVHRVHRAARHNVPPPGWTAEDDRREEFADLSMLTVLRKAR